MSAAGEPGAPEAGRRPSRLGLVLGIINGTLVGLYPVAVWIGLSYLGARAVGLLVIAFVVPMLAIRLRNADRASFWAILRCGSFGSSPLYQRDHGRHLDQHLLWGGAQECRDR